MVNKVFQGNEYTMPKKKCNSVLQPSPFLIVWLAKGRLHSTEDLPKKKVIIHRPGNKGLKCSMPNIGVLGNGKPANTVNVYRNSNGFIHGSPGN